MFPWACTSIGEGVEDGQMQKKIFYIWTSSNCWCMSVQNVAWGLV